MELIFPVVELIFPDFSSPAARKSDSFAFIYGFHLRFPCLVPLGRQTCLPFHLSDDIFDRYMTCKCDRYMTVTAFDPPPGSCTPLQV